MMVFVTHLMFSVAEQGFFSRFWLGIICLDIYPDTIIPGIQEPDTIIPGVQEPDPIIPGIQERVLSYRKYTYSKMTEMTSRKSILSKVAHGFPVFISNNLG
jgi:hypothetical protein